MAEEKNCINADEYLANNPFMRHNHMKIERISTECSEISMEVHPDGLNIMGMIHGGLLYSLVRRGRVITIVRGEVTGENGKLLADVTADMFCVGQEKSD